MTAAIRGVALLGVLLPFALSQAMVPPGSDRIIGEPGNDAWGTKWHAVSQRSTRPRAS